MLNGKWDLIGEELASIAQTLEHAGCDYIAIATNTMHKLADYVQSKISVPLIHIADCVADECKNCQVKNVGLLGTKYTMVETFLKSRLEENGLVVSTPEDEHAIDEIDRIIFDELCKGEIKDSSREYYIETVQKMIEKDKIEGVILGCTEIEMLLRRQDLEIPIFDTTQAHINQLVDLSLERKIKVLK